jgi:hypothetical protein
VTGCTGDHPGRPCPDTCPCPCETCCPRFAPEPDGPPGDPFGRAGQGEPRDQLAGLLEAGGWVAAVEAGWVLAACLEHGPTWRKGCPHCAALPPPEPDPLAGLLGGRSLTEFMDAFTEGTVTVPLDQLAALTDAWQARYAEQLAADGIVPVCVVHGDPECQADIDRINTLHRLAVDAGLFRTLTGGHDWTCFHFEGPDAETAATRFTGLADSIAPADAWWWNTTRTAHPVYPGGER